jgi:hypothetical protein
MLPCPRGCRTPAGGRALDDAVCERAPDRREVFKVDQCAVGYRLLIAAAKRAARSRTTCNTSETLGKGGL